AAIPGGAARSHGGGQTNPEPDRPIAQPSSRAECRAQTLSRRCRSRRLSNHARHDADPRVDAHIRGQLRRLSLGETDYDLAKIVGRNLAGDLDGYRRALPQRDTGGWCDRKAEEPRVTQDRVRDSRLDHDGLALALALEIEEFDERPERHQDEE